MKIEDNIQICLFYEEGVPKQSNFFSKIIRTGYYFYNKKVITGIHFFLTIRKGKNNEFEELIAWIKIKIEFIYRFILV